MMKEYTAVYFGRFFRGLPHRVRWVTVYAYNREHAERVAIHKVRKGEVFKGLD